MMNAPKHLTDEELVERIAALNRAERGATAALVAHLAELEQRDLHLVLGFRSLYGYCRAVLHLSEHESYNRMEAAHVARRLPVVVPLLAEGLLHLTAVRLLAPHLADENHLALLGAAMHKSKAEVKQLLAAWFPKPDVRTSIRRVTAAAPAPAVVATPALLEPPAAREGDRQLFEAEDASGGSEAGARSKEAKLEANEETTEARPGRQTDPPQAPERRKARIDPLSAESYAMRLTARSETIERLRRAQDILSHAVPDGDVDEILFRALGALIEQEERKRGMAPARRRSSVKAARPTAKKTIAEPSRRVAASVEREVRERDGHACAFVAADGRRCGEKRFVEIHHLKPWIAGGPETRANLGLRCRAHNQYEWNVYVAPIRRGMDAMATRSGTSAALPMPSDP